MLSGISNKLVLVLVAVLLASCGGIGSKGNGSGSGNIFGGKQKSNPEKKKSNTEATFPVGTIQARRLPDGTTKPPRNAAEARRQKDGPIQILDLLKGVNDNADIRVNKYIWEASLQTLNFLPIEAADPFSGVLVMGWGRAPGSSTDFRATILVQDPALEAGSLQVAMQKRNGPASAETNRQIENAILTRARQLRIKGAKRR